MRYSFIAAHREGFRRDALYLLHDGAPGNADLFSVGLAAFSAAAAVQLSTQMAEIYFSVHGLPSLRQGGPLLYFHEISQIVLTVSCPLARTLIGR